MRRFILASCLILLLVSCTVTIDYSMYGELYGTSWAGTVMVSDGQVTVPARASVSYADGGSWAVCVDYISEAAIVVAPHWCEGGRDFSGINWVGRVTYRVTYDNITDTLHVTANDGDVFVYGTLYRLYILYSTCEVPTTLSGGYVARCELFRGSS